MPTYDYKRADGSIFETFQSITADPLTECPTTGQPVHRVISGGTGFILKGTGFYQTDYAAKPAPQPAKDSGKEEKESKADSKSEDKATKDEKKPSTSKSEN